MSNTPKNSLQVVVLAAGKGTRMNSARPKVLHELAGRPMLQQVLHTAKQLGCEQPIVVVGFGASTVQQRILAIPDLAACQFVLQEPQLGTGHAVQQALPLLTRDSAVLVLYGDVPLVQVESLRPLLQAAEQGQLALLTARTTYPNGYGRIVRNQAAEVVAIVEEKDATESQRQIQEINTGIVCAPAAKLREWLAQLQNNNAQGEFYLTDIVAMAHAQGVAITSFEALSFEETQGVNDPIQLARLERQFQQRQALALQQQGVQLLDPSRFDLRGELVCGHDVQIDVGCVFVGKVQLGDGVRVGPYCVIKNTSIEAQTVIESHSVLDGALVGQSCQIGPFARLRPGTQLKDKVHIGNFTEVKNSVIEEQSKANHLAYLGDCDIGKRVNVGAGTIACNYDGVNKYRTVIEDDVFIGSDTQLVAPVRVGKGATLGAGTTLSKDAPAGQLTLSRVKQQSLPNWQRPVKK